MTRTSRTKLKNQATRPTQAQLGISETVHDILKQLPAIVYQCGPPPDFATIFVSGNVEAQLGYTPDKFYADPFFWSKQLHGNDRPCVLAKLSSIGDDDLISYEYRFRRSDGKYSWLHDRVSVSRDSNRLIVGLIGSCFDVTEHKQLETFQLGF